ncbi:MAG: dihydroorotate dehydrogenase [Candidatus Woesearchaeota archaeon]
MKSSKEDILRIMSNERLKLTTVSGILTTRPAMIRWVNDNIDIDMITTKSYQVRPNRGNREPIIVEESMGNFGNAVGLRNPGMEKGFDELYRMLEREGLRAILNISLSADNIEDYITLVKRFGSIADILELNFSCPHAKKGFGATIGSSPGLVKEYITGIRKHTDALLFPKLTPDVDDIGEIAYSAIKAGADGISAINTAQPKRFTEPTSGRAVLYNPAGQKGGRSGTDINGLALRCIRDIRQSVGNDVPIIGIGGVSSGEDARRMREAGADVVGLGSVLARVDSQERLPQFVEAIRKDAETGSEDSDVFLEKRRLAQYIPFSISEMKQKSDNQTLMVLDGKMEYEASQFAFIWHPDLGEKPFSIARSDPLTFLIREKGKFTKGLIRLKEGEKVMVRGVYGKAPHLDESTGDAYVIAGGTGIAIVPRLVEELSGHKKNIIVYHGITSRQESCFKEEISRFAHYIPVEDDDVKARVIDVFKEDLDIEDIGGASFYNIGPPGFMEIATRTERDAGADAKDIHLSLETNCMCGIGLCGECECGGKLVCKEGTMFTLEYLEKQNIWMDGLQDDHGHQYR